MQSKSGIPLTLQSKVKAWNKANQEHQKLAREINAGLKKNVGKPMSKGLQSKIEQYKKQTKTLTEKKAAIMADAQKRGLSVKQKKKV